MNKLKYEDVKEEIEKEGYKLLSKEYKNNYTKLKLECPEGHIFWMIWNCWQRGQRCPECVKITYEFVKEEIEKEGYKLLSEKYKGALKKLKLQCPEGHIYEVTWSHFQQKGRCNQCSINRQKHSYEYVKEEIEKDGYKLLSKEYKNNYTKLKLECPEGHIFWMIYNNFQQGVRCPNCWNENGSSRQEKEVLEYIQSITDTIIIKNDRTQILNINTGWNLELDVFLPELKKAIEYNGTYWHNNDYQKYKDLIKQDQCKEKGIELLVVNEKEWIKNNNKCKNNIKKFIIGELDK